MPVQLSLKRIKKTTQISLPTVIENLYVDGKNTPLLYDEEVLFLPPSTSRLSFHYAGLSFIYAAETQFPNKITGL